MDATKPKQSFLRICRVHVAHDERRNAPIALLSLSSVSPQIISVFGST